MKLKLNAKDSNIFAIGMGPFLGYAAASTSYGPPTSTKGIYELFYPRATYFMYSNAQAAAGTTNDKINYPYSGTAGTTAPDLAPQHVISVFPSQMEAFAQLYKYARVERVDFLFKITNLGVSKMNSAGGGTSPDNPMFKTSTVTHTSVVLPYSQVSDWSSSWGAGATKSETYASQLAETTGATQSITHQDGNKETIYIKKSLDLTQQQAGDTVRSRTWMTSGSTIDSSSNSYWTFPPRTNADPVLVNIGTSPLIDEQLQNLGYMANADNNNFWFRYNEQVSVQYHLTFWEPKTQQLTFSN